MRYNAKTLLAITLSYLLFYSLSFSVPAYAGACRCAMEKIFDCYSDAIDQKQCDKIIAAAPEKKYQFCGFFSDLSNCQGWTAGGGQTISINTFSLKEDVPAEEKLPFQAIAPKPEVDIPTLKPFTTTTIKPDSEGYIYIPFLGQYIAAIFRWSLLIAGIIASVLIMFGGFVYMTSGGNAQRAKEGKERAAQALLGLILLLASYSILYIFNPDLVSFKSLKIQVIERIDVPEDFEAMPTPSGGPACTGPNDKSKASPDGNKTYLGQLDNQACGTRDLKKILYIVLHEGGSSTQSTVSIFKSRHVSSHYSIDRDGTIYQLAGEEKTAWHAGAINQFSIGIDLSITKNFPLKGKCPLDKCTWTDEQYQAVNQLINSIINRTGARKDSNSIIGHCQVTGTDHTDPRNFDWTKIGLSNADHYENGNVQDKCKIIFDYAKQKEYLKQYSPENFVETGCCMVISTSGGDFDPFLSELTQKSCDEKEKELQLANPGLTLYKSWAKKSCSQK